MYDVKYNFIVDVLIWTCIAVFVAHYFHQHMVLFEDRWLGWSFYIFPVAGVTLLPVIVISSLRLVHHRHSDKTEYLTGYCYYIKHLWWIRKRWLWIKSLITSIEIRFFERGSSLCHCLAITIQFGNENILFALFITIIDPKSFVGNIMTWSGFHWILTKLQVMAPWRLFFCMCSTCIVSMRWPSVFSNRFW